MANIPKGVKVVYNGTTYTGTLEATSATPGAFYLVKSSSDTSDAPLDVYDEYVPIDKAGQAGTKTWEKIGDTQIDLKDVVTGVTFNKDTISVVTGYSSPTSDVALGEATTFALTSGEVTFGTPTTDTFVKSVSAETGKNLVTTSITPAGTATSVINSVTDTTRKLAVSSVTGVQATTTTASKATAGTSQTTLKNTSTASTTNTDWLKGVSVANETLTIGAAVPDTQTTTQFTFADVTVPIKNASATTVATGALADSGTGADVMTATSTGSTSVATVGSAVTVATGATSTTGTGDAVVTGVTVGSSAAAVTALPTASVGTGITVGTNDKVTAITGLGTPSTATVLTSNTDITVTKGA